MEEGSRGLGTNKYVIAAFLFVLSYGVLFALGSARQGIANAVANVPILNIFLPIPEFTSPLFWLMPVAGFFFLFFLVDWLNGYFKGRLGFSIVVPVLFFVFAILAFYVALFWYLGQFSELQTRQTDGVRYTPLICLSEKTPQCIEKADALNEAISNSGAKLADERVLRYMPYSFRDKLQSTAFYLFVLAGLLGWASRFSLEKIKL